MSLQPTQLKSRSWNNMLLFSQAANSIDKHFNVVDTTMSGELSPSSHSAHCGRLEHVCIIKRVVNPPLALTVITRRSRVHTSHWLLPCLDLVLINGEMLGIAVSFSVPLSIRKCLTRFRCSTCSTCGKTHHRRALTHIAKVC